MSAGLEPVKGTQGIEGPLAVEELVGVVIIKDNFATETVPNDPYLIVPDRSENLVLSFCIREKAIEFGYFDEGPSPANKVAR